MYAFVYALERAMPWIFVAMAVVGVLMVTLSMEEYCSIIAVVSLVSHLAGVYLDRRGRK